MAVEIAEAYVSLVPSAEGFAAKVADQLGGPLDDTGRQGGEKLSKGLFSGLGGKAATAGLAVGASLGAGVAAAGAGLFALGATFDDAFDAIRVQTGATGDALGGLTDSFKRVFANVPTTTGDASAAIGTLNQKLGLTGAPLENLSTQLLNLSRITETDLTSNLKGAVDVFNSFGIAAEDQPARLDQLFRASQATGTSVDTLAATMASAGPNLQQLGLSFEQSAALLGVFGKAGVDAGAIMPALSKSIVQAAKDGKSAGDVFRGTFDAIRNAPDDTAAAGAAIETFGAKAGPKLAGLIRQGKLGYEELAASIASGGDTINGAAADTADFAEQWGTFKNKILVGLEPIATKVFGAVGDAMTAIGPKIGPVIDKIVAGFSGFAASLGEIDFAKVFGDAQELLGPIVDALVELGGASFEVLKASLETVIQLFQDNRDVILGVLDAIKVGLTTAVDVLVVSFRFLADHMGLVKAIAVPLLAAFVGFKVVSGIISAISIATKIWTAVQTAFNVVMALNPIGLVVAGIAALVAGVIYAYTHFETFRNIVDGFFDIFQAGFSWIVEHWQLLLAILIGPIGIAAKLIIDHWEGVRGAFVAAFDWVRDNWPTLLAILTGPIGLAVLAIVRNWDTIRDTFIAVKDAIAGAVGQVVSFFAALPGRILGALGDIAGQIWSVFQRASDRVAGTVETIIGFYLSLPGRILGALGNVGSLLYQAGLDIGGSLLHGIANSLRAGFDFAGAIVGNISGAVRGAINSVIDELNWAIPNHFGWGPVGFDIPANPIPRLAQGGIVTRATVAMIGERGPEAVIPLGGGSSSLAPSGQFRDLIINPRTEASAEKIAREVRWAQLTAGV